MAGEGGAANHQAGAPWHSGEVTESTGRLYGMDDPMPSDVMGLLRVMNNNNVNGPRNPVLASAVQTNPEMFSTFAKNWLAAAQAAYNESDASEDMKLLKSFISSMEKAVGQA